MRPDLKDVILDTGRDRYTHGNRDRSFRRHRKDRRFDDHQHEGMRERYGGWRNQRDRLAPLRRMLRKQLGRPWDDVWSEICARADARSLRGLHLREHVLWEVDVNDAEHRGRRGWGGFYVDKSGILRCQPGRGRGRRC